MVTYKGAISTDIALTVNGGTGATAEQITAGTGQIGLNVTGVAGNAALVSTGFSTTMAPALRLINNPPSSPTDFLLTIDTLGNVKQGTASSAFGNFNSLVSEV